MRLHHAAGVFGIETYSEGYPMIVTLRFGCRELRFDHRDLPDLLHIVERLRRDVGAALPDGSKHEVMG